MPLCTIVNCSQKVKRSVYSPLFGTCEAASTLSGFRHPSARKMLRDTLMLSKSRGEAARWVHGTWGEAERTWFVLPWEEKVKGQSQCSLHLPNRRTQRWQSRAFPRGRALNISHTSGMRNDGHKLENGKFSLEVAEVGNVPRRWSDDWAGCPERLWNHYLWRY